MTIEVIGAGFGRTGTLSLKQALEQLGFDKCYHMVEVFQNPDHLEQWTKATRGEPVDWPALFAGYRASVDWPSCNFWELQLEAFPDAKVILSERDPERWYESVMNTIYPSSRKARDSAGPAMKPWVEMAFELIWDGTFHGRIEDREHAIDVYLAHNEYVKKQAPRDRLLVFEPSQGWEPLCEFLGCSVPDEPYPRVNTTEEFQARSGS
ncbi:MAG: sulfotransferase family protein [Gammaproteobacteria bacterium]|nr:sulfotransferase family protein [Gammaproteobacteria bacterium]|tara:strand:- start:1025 stop:1648 length:624 start_codon:yes stop_codon:yes gene_type:complete